MEFKNKGILFVVSGPSGSGKSTICKKIRDLGEADFSVSCTTREPRPTEKDGVDYYFISEEEFAKKVDNNEFIEHAVVHGHRYGTLKKNVLKKLEEGKVIMLDIDVQGAQQLRLKDSEELKNNLISVFIMPPSMAELKQRLANRHTETEEQLKVRLGVALDEIKHHVFYDYVIISSNRASDLEKFGNILSAEKLKTFRQEFPVF